MKKSLLALTYAFAIAIFAFGPAVRAQAQTVTFLYQFSGTQGGATSMVQGLDGNLYGTSYAGDFGHGSVFRMTPDGDFHHHLQFLLADRLPGRRPCDCGACPRK